MASIKPTSPVVINVPKSLGHLTIVGPNATSFTGLQASLDGLLDRIRDAATKGRPVPKQAKAEPGTTDAGASMYGSAYAEAKDVITRYVNTLSPNDLDSLSGLGFTDPNDESKKRGDITGSVLSSWDRAAAAYMKSDRAGGDAARQGMYHRLGEFDAAVQGSGAPAVVPDQ